MKYLVCNVLLLSSLAISVTCYKTYSALHSIVFTNMPEVNETVHSEYFYGKCATRDKELVMTDHLKYEDIKGKLIVRGYLNTTENINCVYLRSQSPFGEMVMYRPTRFSMCLSKIRYHYLGKFFIFRYYEWFLPVEMKKGIDWDLYFYVA